MAMNEKDMWLAVLLSASTQPSVRDWVTAVDFTPSASCDIPATLMNVVVITPCAVSDAVVPWLVVFVLELTTTFRTSDFVSRVSNMVCASGTDVFCATARTIASAVESSAACIAALSADPRL